MFLLPPLPGGVLVLVRQVSKRTKRGLFAGKKVLSGNNISDDGGNKTRRVWKPNAQNASLYSEVLDKKIRFKVTAAALRSIDKSGGLDKYILSNKKLESERGLELRMEILKQLDRNRTENVVMTTSDQMGSHPPEDTDTA